MYIQLCSECISKLSSGHCLWTLKVQPVDSACTLRCNHPLVHLMVIWLSEKHVSKNHNHLASNTSGRKSYCTKSRVADKLIYYDGEDSYGPENVSLMFNGVRLRQLFVLLYLGGLLALRMTRSEPLAPWGTDTNHYPRAIIFLCFT